MAVAPFQLCKVEPQLCEAMEKECPQCTRKFRPGRIDQVYCNNLCRQRAYLDRKNSSSLEMPVPGGRNHLSVTPPANNHLRPVWISESLPLPLSMEDVYDEEPSFQEERTQLLLEIQTWLAAVMDAIHNRSIDRLRELQVDMQQTLSFRMYYEPEHNTVLSPMAGLTAALELSIDRFQEYELEENTKWLFLEKEFCNARTGCKI